MRRMDRGARGSIRCALAVGGLAIASACAGDSTAPSARRDADLYETPFDPNDYLAFVESQDRRFLEVERATRGSLEGYVDATQELLHDPWSIDYLVKAALHLDSPAAARPFEAPVTATPTAVVTYLDGAQGQVDIHMLCEIGALAHAMRGRGFGPVVHEKVVQISDAIEGSCDLAARSFIGRTFATLKLGLDVGAAPTAFEHDAAAAISNDEITRLAREIEHPNSESWLRDSVGEMREVARAICSARESDGASSDDIEVNACVQRHDALVRRALLDAGSFLPDPGAGR